MNQNFLTLLSVVFLLVLADKADCQDFSGMGAALVLAFLLLCFIAMFSAVPPLCFLIFIITPKAKESLFWIGAFFLALMLPFFVAWASSGEVIGRNILQMVNELRSGDSPFRAFDILRLCIVAAPLGDAFLFAIALRVYLRRRSRERNKYVDFDPSDSEYATGRQ